MILLGQNVTMPVELPADVFRQLNPAQLRRVEDAVAAGVKRGLLAAATRKTDVVVLQNFRVRLTMV